MFDEHFALVTRQSGALSPATRAFMTLAEHHIRAPAEAGVRGWLLVAVVLVLGGLAWHGVRDLGPLYVTAAARHWAMGTPVDRASWLRPALGWVAVVGAGCGALSGGLVALVGDAGAGPVVAGAGLGVAVPAAAVVAQAAKRGASGRVAPAVVVGGWLAVALGWWRSMPVALRWPRRRFRRPGWRCSRCSSRWPP